MILNQEVKFSKNESIVSARTFIFIKSAIICFQFLLLKFECQEIRKMIKKILNENKNFIEKIKKLQSIEKIEFVFLFKRLFFQQEFSIL